MRKLCGTILAAAMAALSARGAFDVRDFGVSGDEYLDLVEAAVAAYPDEHVEEYIDDADRNGVHTIRISNATAWTPDIDRMTVVLALADSASCGK